jgi:serine O-acetyltransferase
VSRVVELLRKLLFPGYYDDENQPSGSLDSTVSELLDEVRSKLSQLICCSLNLENPAGKCHAEIYPRARDICLGFLSGLPRLRETLLRDVQAAYDGDPAASNTHEIIFAYPGFFAVCVYRLAHELYRLDIPLIPRIMTEYAHCLTGIDIHPGAEIGCDFFIDHGTGTVIGETTVIGDRVKLYQGVTLGGLSTRGGQSLRGKKRHPTIEDEVTVYSGASILGGDTVVGRGCVVGGNAFITQSVPPNTRVYMKAAELGFKEL